MRDITKDILREATRDDVHVGMVDDFVCRAGVADLVAARQIGQAGVRAVVLNGLAVIGYGLGPSGAQPRETALESLAGLERGWSEGWDPMDLDWVSLTPDGDVIGLKLCAERQQIEERFVMELASRWPQVAGDLDLRVRSDRERLRLRDILHEGAGGRLPNYRGRLPESVLTAAFVEIDRLWQVSDQETKAVVEDAVFNLLPRDREAFVRHLGPLLQAQLLGYERRLRAWNIVV